MAHSQNVQVGDNNYLFLRLNDQNHGLAWFGGTKLFNGVDPDGPVLFGYRGGMLGTRNLGSHIEKIALQWNNKNDVRIFDKLYIAQPTATISSQSRVNIYGDDSAWPLTVNFNETHDWQTAASIHVTRDNTLALQIVKNGADIFVVRGNGVVNASKLYAKEVEIRPDAITISWPDYVFEKDYKILRIDDLEKFVTTHKHLPEFPSAEEIQSTGINVADMQALLLKKIEELSLYIIELNKRIEYLEQK
ncbi:MAG: hypothetical protein IPK08_04075 [Bacteroidetes bacterium]|nr:hypothetical protein [Bacteroidota bacterium]